MNKKGERIQHILFNEELNVLFAHFFCLVKDTGDLVGDHIIGLIVIILTAFEGISFDSMSAFFIVLTKWTN